MNKSNLTVTLRGLNIEFDGLYTIERVTWADPEEFWDWCAEFDRGYQIQAEQWIKPMWLMGVAPEVGKVVPGPLEEEVRDSSLWTDELRKLALKQKETR